jgi:hypothetical protein
MTSPQLAISGPVKRVDYDSVPASLVRLDVFDKLEVDGIVRSTGAIIKCLDEVCDGVCVMVCMMVCV